MKILITGINGFIGNYLARELINRKHAVIGLGRSDRCNIKGIDKYIKGSVLDKSIIEDAFNNTDVVVHLAALTAHSDIIQNKYKTLEVNFQGTKNVLDVFSNSLSARKFIFSSTMKVYGAIQQLPFDEKDSPQPINILGKSKYIAERLIDFYSNGNKAYVLLRISNIFGEGQRENFLIPTILSQLRNNKNTKGIKEITLGDIKAERDYVYIKDVINAFVLAIEKDMPHPLEIINICSGIPRSAEDVISKIEEFSNYKIKVHINKNLLRDNEMDKEYGTYEKAKAILGWQPKNDLYDWVKKILQTPSHRRGI